MGNILYSKEMLGQFGKPIKIPKIRTMIYDGEETMLSKEKNGLGKIINDPRIIPARKVLRKFWIDELPQLFYNILWKKLTFRKTDLRLVGIRPKSEKYWELFSLEHKKNVFKYKPGFFGINYAHNDVFFDSIEKLETDYLEQKESSPILTDIKYFLMIFNNIVFRNMRSE